MGYTIFEKDKEIMNPRIKALEMEVKPGETVYDSYRNALKLAVEFERTVVFIHNGQDYKVNYKSVLDFIFEENRR